MNKRVILGAVVGLAVVALVIIGIVMYTNNGGNLASAVNCGSCTGCSSSGSCSTQKNSNQQQSYGSNYQRQDLQSQGSNFGEIEKAAVEFYETNYGGTGLTARAQQSGCCVVAVIYKDGKPIDSLRYHGGQFYK